MNKLFATFIAFFFCAGLVFAEPSIFDQVLTPSDTNSSSAQDVVMDSSTVLRVQKIPSRIYRDQKFSVTVQAEISNENFDSIQTEFADHSNVEVINKESQWTFKESGIYQNTYFFRATSSSFAMPILTLKLYNGDNKYSQATLSIDNPTFVDIGAKPYMFSNLICDEIKILSVKTKTFDKKNTITVFEVRAKNGNLNDFRLKNSVDQGIENIKEDGSYSEMTYFTIMPAYQKELEFDYYNSSENSYKKITVPLTIEDDTVSTQTDLNPKDSSFYFYKIYFYIFLIATLIVFFLYKKNKIIIFITILPLYLLYDLTLNNDKGVLKTNSNIYILPTENSTVFKTLDSEVKVEIINENEKFIKVIFPDKQIGWAKKNDLK